MDIVEAGDLEREDGRAASDLRRWLERRGALSVGEGVEIALLACAAVAEGHGRGLAYGRLCPDNVLASIRPDGSLEITLDVPGVPRGATVPPAADLRALAYRAPEELVTSAAFDRRSDVWALGAILFYLLAARDPFAADTAAGVRARVLEEPAPRLREARPGVPAVLAWVVDRCLERYPMERYASMAELARALAPFAPERARAFPARAAEELDDARAIAPPDPAIAAPGLPPSSAPDLDEAPPALPVRGQRAAALALAALATVALVALGVLAFASAIRVPAPPKAPAVPPVARAVDRASIPDPELPAPPPRELDRPPQATPPKAPPPPPRAGRVRPMRAEEAAPPIGVHDRPVEPWGIDDGARGARPRY